MSFLFCLFFFGFYGSNEKAGRKGKWQLIKRGRKGGREGREKGKRGEGGNNQRIQYN